MCFKKTQNMDLYWTMPLTQSSQMTTVAKLKGYNSPADKVPKIHSYVWLKQYILHCALNAAKLWFWQTLEGNKLYWQVSLYKNEQITAQVEFSCLFNENLCFNNLHAWSYGFYGCPGQKHWWGWLYMWRYTRDGNVTLCSLVVSHITHAPVGGGRGLVEFA